MYAGSTPAGALPETAAASGFGDNLPGPLRNFVPILSRDSGVYAVTGLRSHNSHKSHARAEEDGLGAGPGSGDPSSNTYAAPLPSISPVSRGPGKIETAVTATVEAGAVEDGLPQPITYSELARSTYSTAAPTAAQIESVGRVCRRLRQRDQVELWKVRNDGQRYEGAVSRIFTAEEEALDAERRKEREAERAESLLVIQPRLH